MPASITLANTNSFHIKSIVSSVATPANTLVASELLFVFIQTLVGIANASSSAPSAAALRQAVPQSTVVGIFRDLRGIAMATNSRRTYGMLLLQLLFC